MKLIIGKQFKIFSLVFMSTLLLGVYGSQISVYGQEVKSEKSNLTAVADQFSKTLSELNINASELTLQPGENVTVFIEKFSPNGTLSEFAKKFTESVKGLGIDVDKLKSLKQVENITQSAKELANLQ